jgi:excinuclease ABC subunit A
MTAAEGAEFFSAVPAIARKLQTLIDVGLGYVRLGQSATTLSGGEAQRVKLARELARKSTGRSLYILDEPTSGLHFDDVRKLLEVLQRLTDEGNTMVIVEHDFDIIKSADYVIELGPEGGARGGYLVAHGTPERLIQVADSVTGAFLRQVVEGS